MLPHAALWTGQGLCQNRRRRLVFRLTIWARLDICDGSALFPECLITHTQCGTRKTDDASAFYSSRKINLSENSSMGMNDKHSMDSVGFFFFNRLVLWINFHLNSQMQTFRLPHQQNVSVHWVLYLTCAQVAFFTDAELLAFSQQHQPRRALCCCMRPILRYS